MNKELRELFDQNHIVTKKITLKNSVRIIDSGSEQFVIKRRDKSLNELYKYLKSRSFDYFPEILYQTNHYDVYRYIEDVDISKEERAEDIIKLVTLLHGKTTFYKEIDDDTYKELYENIIKQLDYLVNYYNDMAEIIEREEYMTPSHYYFIRNISKVFASLSYCRYHVDKWYDIIEKKKRIRIVNLHNNLSLDHYLMDGDKPFLISWRLSKRDIPIYDLIKLYRQYYKELDFCELLRKYEMHYPMLPEEKILFFVLISIPERLDFRDSEYQMCKKVQRFYDYLSANEKLIEDYLPKEKKSVET
ncbi:MAG: hypothetical protein MR598_04925 [Erysipelotrichaceae bacterium]|nr:hypothetical protein [Erysipelotrichaceae bacterium]